MEYMTQAIVTKIGPKYQVVIPKKIRQSLKLNVGDFIEASASTHGVLFKPKIVVDRPLDAALDEALADVKAGRMSRRFKSASALVSDIKSHTSRVRAKNKQI